MDNNNSSRPSIDHYAFCASVAGLVYMIVRFLLFCHCCAKHNASWPELGLHRLYLFIYWILIYRVDSVIYSFEKQGPCCLSFSPSFEVIFTWKLIINLQTTWQIITCSMCQSSDCLKASLTRVPWEKQDERLNFKISYLIN